MKLHQFTKTPNMLCIAALISSLFCMNTHANPASLEDRINQLEMLVKAQKENNNLISEHNETLIENLKLENEQLRIQISEQQNLIQKHNLKQESDENKDKELSLKTSKQNKDVADSESTKIYNWNNDEDSIEETENEKKTYDEKAKDINKKGSFSPKKSKCGCKKKREAKNEHDSFLDAFDSMQNNNYKIAEAKYSDFIWRFPNSPKVAIAYFWLGELNLQKWQEDSLDEQHLHKAVAYFKTIVNDHKSHVKYKDALLKLGLIENKRGNSKKAAKYFTMVKNNFPNTSVAKLATINLKRLQN